MHITRLAAGSPHAAAAAAGTSRSVGGERRSAEQRLSRPTRSLLGGR